MIRMDFRYVRSLLGWWAFFAIPLACAERVDASSEARCESLETVSVPVADQPGATERTRLDAACSSDEMYYAAPGQRDDAGARLCAYLEREAGDEPMFSGAGILMMIYANARGVPRNIRLAQKFACELGGAPAELDGRLAHLDQFAEHIAGAADAFDLCDDITSGYMQGNCAIHAAQAEGLRRDARVEAISANWSVAHKAALRTLRIAAVAYFDASAGEVDMSGTARVAMVVAAREEQEQAYLDALVKFERGEFPHGDAVSLKQADAALNAQYARLIKLATPAEGADSVGALGTVKVSDIRAAQRAWISYRDAWVAFCAEKYPQVAAEAWREWLTRKRTANFRQTTGVDGVP
ncbi:MAG: lysozyme inhibitor LprI family protein [Tahibacter sp.]